MHRAQELAGARSRVVAVLMDECDDRLEATAVLGLAIGQIIRAWPAEDRIRFADHVAELLRQLARESL
jgi:hypothetical protein